MLTIRIIPSLLISGGRLVKGVKFRNHVDVGDPVTTSKALEAQGADEIILIDLDVFDNHSIKHDLDSLNKISKNLMTAITFGGGINSIEQAEKIFRNGADKIIISNVLFKNKNIVNEIADIYGDQSIICGVNLIKKKEKFCLLEDPDINLEDWIKKINNLPIVEIKYTFVDFEGTKKGFDLSFCNKIINLSKHPVIIEGGAGNLSQIKSIEETSVSGIGLGTILIFLILI